MDNIQGMGIKEKKIINKILLSASGKNQVLFRVNVGKAWVGEIVSIKLSGTIQKVLTKLRIFNTGMPTGFPDVFGYTKVKITKDMVGNELPVFTAIEVKTKNTVMTPEQKMFQAAMLKDSVIHSVEKEA